MGRLLAFAGRTDEAAEYALRYATRATALRPDWFFNHFLLDAYQAASGELAAAKTRMANGLTQRGYTRRPSNLAIRLCTRTTPVRSPMG